MGEEVWRDVPNYEGRYEISNYGNIRRFVKSLYRKPRNIPGYKPIKPQVDKDGYLMYTFIKHGIKELRLYGENARNVKLKEDQVLFIRNNYGINHSKKELAKMFDISESHVYTIKRGKTWKRLINENI